MNRFNSKIAILLVDDDAMVRSILTEYLAAMGFKSVRVAKDGDEALRIVQDSSIPLDLIISDWEMPEITGLGLLKAVRNNPHRSATPFIMVTSQRSMERFKITQAAQWKVNSYLMKPFRQNILKNKIFEVMNWSGDRVA